MKLPDNACILGRLPEFIIFAFQKILDPCGKIFFQQRPNLVFQTA